MKNMKRIIVAVLALALLVSAFAFAVSAEEEKEYPYRSGANVAENILEYYTLEDYLADNYDEGKMNAMSEALVSLHKQTAVTYVDDPTGAAEGKALSAEFKRNNAYLNYEKNSDGDSMLTDKLIVSFKLYMPSESKGKSFEFSLKAGVKNGSGVNSVGSNTVLSFNFEKEL